MTRRLVSVSTIEELQASGLSEVCLAPGDVVTPLARDRAQELGLDLVASSTTEEARAVTREPIQATPNGPTSADVRAAVIAALGYEPAGLDQVIAEVW